MAPAVALLKRMSMCRVLSHKSLEGVQTLKVEDKFTGTPGTNPEQRGGRLGVVVGGRGCVGWSGLRCRPDVMGLN